MKITVDVGYDLESNRITLDGKPFGEPLDRNAIVKFLLSTIPCNRAVDDNPAMPLGPYGDEPNVERHDRRPIGDCEGMDC